MAAAKHQRAACIRAWCSKAPTSKPEDAKKQQRDAVVPDEAPATAMVNSRMKKLKRKATEAATKMSQPASSSSSTPHFHVQVRLQSKAEAAARSLDRQPEQKQHQQPEMSSTLPAEKHSCLPELPPKPAKPDKPEHPLSKHVEDIWDKALECVSKGQLEDAEDFLRPLYDIEDLNNAFKEICDTPTMKGYRYMVARYFMDEGHRMLQKDEAEYAKGLYSFSLEVYSDSKEAKNGMASAELRLGNYQEVVQLCNSILTGPATARSLLRLYQPHYKEALKKRGLAFYNLGMQREAWNDLVEWMGGAPRYIQKQLSSPHGFDLFRMKLNPKVFSCNLAYPKPDHCGPCDIPADHTAALIAVMDQLVAKQSGGHTHTPSSKEQGDREVQQPNHHPTAAGLSNGKDPAAPGASAGQTAAIRRIADLGSTGESEWCDTDLAGSLMLAQGANSGQYLLLKQLGNAIVSAREKVEADKKMPRGTCPLCISGAGNCRETCTCNAACEMAASERELKDECLAMAWLNEETHKILDRGDARQMGQDTITALLDTYTVIKSGTLGASHAATGNSNGASMQQICSHMSSTEATGLAEEAKGQGAKADNGKPIAGDESLQMEHGTAAEVIPPSAQPFMQQFKQ